MSFVDFIVIYGTTSCSDKFSGQTRRGNSKRASFQIDFRLCQEIILNNELLLKRTFLERESRTWACQCILLITEFPVPPVQGQACLLDGGHVLSPVSLPLSSD